MATDRRETIIIVSIIIVIKYLHSGFGAPADNVRSPLKTGRGSHVKNE